MKRFVLVTIILLGSLVASAQEQSPLPVQPKSARWIEGSASPSGGRRFALLVGVGSYWRHESWKLPWVGTDVATLGEVLEKEAHFHYVRGLLDNEVTRPALESAVADITRQLQGSGNVVLVYWVGHGYVDEHKEGRYLLSNSDEAGEGEYTATLSESDLKTVLAPLRREGKARVVFVADACRVATMAPKGRKPQEVWLADAMIYSTERGAYAAPRADQKRSDFGAAFESSLGTLADRTSFQLRELFETTRQRMTDSQSAQRPVLVVEKEETRWLVLFDRQNLSFGVRVIDGLAGTELKGAQVKVAGKVTESPATIAGLSEGTYRVEVSKSGWFRAIAEMAIDEKRSGSLLEVPLYPELEVIEGMVKDAGGAPVAGMVCRLEGEHSLFVRGYHRFEDKTDARGRYRFLVPPGAQVRELTVTGGREPRRVPLELSSLHPREEVVAGSIVLRTYDLGPVHLPEGTIVRVEDLGLRDRPAWYWTEAEKFVTEGATGDLDLAIEYYKQAMAGTKDEKARSSIRERIRTAYRDLLAHLMARGRYVDGGTRAKEALEVFAGDKDFSEAVAAFARENIPVGLRERLDAASSAVRRGDFREAERLYGALSGELTALTPYYQEQVTRNLTAVTEKLSLDALTTLGTSWRAGDVPKAVASFEDFRRLRPEDPMVGVWERKLGDQLDAEPPTVELLDGEGRPFQGGRLSAGAESLSVTVVARDNRALARLTVNAEEKRIEVGAKEARVSVTVPLCVGENRFVAEVADRSGRTAKTTLVVERITAPVVAGFTYRGKNAQGKHEYVHDRTGLEFVYIEPGTFTMGSPESESGRDSDETQHRVTISKPFLIAKYEVTQEVWQKVMGSNPSHFKQGGKYPVETVSWNDVMEFCKKVALELPTEAQWEYACRAGTTTAFALGATITPDQVNYDGNYPYGSAPKGQYRQKTVAVDTFQPNAWGLYNMHGNVWEWCADWYGDYPSSSVTDPTGPSGGLGRVDRGGGWSGDARYCRSADRYGLDPSGGLSGLGFRPARSCP
ncbi:MAG: SUMF1/EgtB/PvdO family nonheme iron enzyme [Planctomycetota bacterium]